MATTGEATAIKVALISMVSAIIVALIANADKFGRSAPPASPQVATTVSAPPARPLSTDEAPPAAASPGNQPADKPRSAPGPVQVPVRITLAEPASPTQGAAPALAPGDRRLIAAWGRSNDGVERRFIMRNDTPQPLVRLFVSASSEKSEGPDRLGGVAVPPGISISVDADDGTGNCTYDMRAVFADGRELAQGSFNVCSGLNYMWQFAGNR